MQHLAAAGLTAGAGFMMVACATNVVPSGEPEQAADQPIRDSAPVSPPHGLALLPDPEVRADPRSRYGNNPYEVFGQRYEVLESAVGYDQEGLASWYGQKFHGHTTSSGEIYDMYKLTAAHRTLPIPSYARITNRQNGKSTIVRINDRGPFHPSRIIDLSYASAVKLGFENVGTARVHVASLLPGDLPPPDGGASRFYVHAGPFPNRDRADAARVELGTVSAGEATVVLVDDAFAVRIGPLSTRWAAERVRALLIFREQAAASADDLGYIEGF